MDSRREVCSTPEAYSLWPLLVYGLFQIAAFNSFAVMPFIVESLHASGRADLSQGGWIATVENLIVGAAGLTAPRLMGLRGARAWSAGAALLCAAGNIFSLGQGGAPLFVFRAVAAFGAGGMIAIQSAYVAEHPHAERLSGYYFAASAAVGLFATSAGASYLVPRFGADGLFVFIAIFALLAAVASATGPKSLPHVSIAAVDTPAGKLPVIPMMAGLVLAAVFFRNFYESTVWTYFLPIARHAQVPENVAEASVSVCQALQLFSVLAGAYLVSRLSYSMVLIVASLITIILTTYLFFGAVSSSGFVLFAVALGTFGYFLIPFQVSTLIDLDPSRRAVAMFAMPMVMGSAFGPLVSSAVIVDENVSNAIVLAELCSIASLILYLPIVYYSRRRAPKQAMPWVEGAADV